MQIARKSIHLVKGMKSGDIVLEKNIVSRRPANGISPMDIDFVIGKKLINDLDEDHCLNWLDLSN